MGTLYRIIDRKNKLYYEMDGWSIDAESLKSPASLYFHLTEHRKEEWEIQMVASIIKDVAKYMDFPLEAHSDTGSDFYHDCESEGYRCCGSRFWSYNKIWNKIWSPFDPLPAEANTYFVWDTEPCTASQPKPTLCYFNGRHWCDGDGRPLSIHAPFWWASLDNEYAQELAK